MAKFKKADLTTVIVRSNVTTGGLQPFQEAEVEDNEKTRELVALGLWTLLRPVSPVESQSAELSSDDVPSVPNGDPADTQ